MLPDFNPVQSVSELQIIDRKPGTGREVQANDTVTVDYTGALASNGQVFQSSKEFGEPISFPLNGVIEGWSKGLVGMKEGGTRRLLIPAAQAYGAQSMPGIPANSDLVFDIVLHKIAS